jgi:hypothetical protein
MHIVTPSSDRKRKRSSSLNGNESLDTTESMLLRKISADILVLEELIAVFYTRMFKICREIMDNDSMRAHLFYNDPNDEYYYLSILLCLCMIVLLEVVRSYLLSIASMITESDEEDL